MNIPKNVMYEILYFLDWEEFYNIIKHLKLNIQQQLKQYEKSNKSLQKITIDNICIHVNEYVEIVQYFHNIGKDFSEYSIDVAIQKGHLKIVQYLHENGIQVLHKNNSGYINLASMYGHLEIVKYLYKNGQKYTKHTINYAIQYKHHDIANYLLKLNNE
jgi:hypothetical protein